MCCITLTCELVFFCFFLQVQHLIIPDTLSYDPDYFYFNQKEREGATGATSFLKINALLLLIICSYIIKVATKIL